MKVGGVTVTAPSEELLVIPRDEANIVFRAQALPSMDEFYTLCPEPTPPVKFVSGVAVPEPENPEYQKILAAYERKKLAYLVVHSLKPSSIEWETVDLSNHKTWSKWDDDLRKAGMTQSEINRVFALVLEANSLNEAKLRKAREAFLRGQAQASAAISGLRSEQPSSQSGEPAPESE